MGLGGGLGDAGRGALWDKAPTCSVCRVLWCKYLHPGQFQGPGVTSPNAELGRDTQLAPASRYKPAPAWPCVPCTASSEDTVRMGGLLRGAGLNSRKRTQQANKAQRAGPLETTHDPLQTGSRRTAVPKMEARGFPGQALLFRVIFKSKYSSNTEIVRAGRKEEGYRTVGSVGFTTKMTQTLNPTATRLQESQRTQPSGHTHLSPRT